MKCARVNDVGGSAFDEVHHVVKGCTKIKFVVVLFDIANVRRADAIFQAEQCVALQNGLVLENINSSQAWTPTIEGADEGVGFEEYAT